MSDGGGGRGGGGVIVISNICDKCMVFLTSIVYILVLLFMFVEVDGGRLTVRQLPSVM